MPSYRSTMPMLGRRPAAPPCESTDRPPPTSPQACRGPQHEHAIRALEAMRRARVFQGETIKAAAERISRSLGVPPSPTAVPFRSTKTGKPPRVVPGPQTCRALQMCEAWRDAEIEALGMQVAEELERRLGIGKV